MKTPRVQDFDPTAKIPQLGSPMDNLPSIQKPSDNQIASKPVNQQTSKDVSQQASKPANQQDSLLAKKQTSKEANQQVGLPAYQQRSKLLKKFSSYLSEDSLKGLKRIAFETERKDYEVLQEAVDAFLQKKKE
jgi:hypothetical protein